MSKFDKVIFFVGISNFLVLCMEKPDEHNDLEGPGGLTHKERIEASRFPDDYDDDASGEADEPRRITDNDVYDGLSASRRVQSHSSVRSDAEYAISMDRVISREVTRRRERRYSEPLPQIGQDKELPPELPPKELYMVEFEGPDDPLLPFNWSTKKKVFQVLIYVVPNILISFMSSIYGPTLPMIEKEFKLGVTPAALGISLFVLGFALGPVVWGPLSEVYGRFPPYMISQIAFICCAFASATAPNVQTLMLSRFFGGSFGAGAIAVMPAMISDQFTAAYRGNAMTCFTLATITGPLVSPIVGAFIAYSYLGWRWTQYIIAIPACATTLIFAFFAKESYRPVLLVSKAEEMRARTGNWGIFAAQESASFNFREVCTNNIVRPIHMLLTEPVLLVISVYVGFVYGILYMCLEAFPIIFSRYEEAGRGFHKGVKYLPYIGLLVGTLIAGAINLIYFGPKFLKLLEKYETNNLPESRLVPMMTGAISFPIGIFWVCWTGAYAEYVHWIVPCVGAAFIMYGVFQIFLQSVNYITDVYINFAASANSATAFLRAAMAAAFPLFATQMFNNLGVQWAGTLIGCLSVVALPFPFIFYKFGKHLRVRSPYAFKSDCINQN